MAVKITPLTSTLKLQSSTDVWFNGLIRRCNRSIKSAAKAGKSSCIVSMPKRLWNEKFETIKDKVSKEIARSGYQVSEGFRAFVIKWNDDTESTNGIANTSEVNHTVKA